MIMFMVTAPVRTRVLMQMFSVCTGECVRSAFFGNARETVAKRAKNKPWRQALLCFSILLVERCLPLMCVLPQFRSHRRHPAYL